MSFETMSVHFDPLERTSKIHLKRFLGRVQEAGEMNFQRFFKNMERMIGKNQCPLLKQSIRLILKAQHKNY